jgi:hypothetical protein
MKKLFSLLLLSVFLASGAHAALYTGDVTGGGLFTGSVTRDDAWILENPLNGDEVNFWSFSGVAGQTLSIFVTSDVLDSAVSLYSGVLNSEFELLVPGFAHSADFAGLSYLTSSPFWGTPGNDVSLLDILLPTTGFYTIAVGGEGFGGIGNFDYAMSVSAIPIPAAAWLFGSAVAGVLALRRRRAA